MSVTHHLNLRGHLRSLDHTDSQSLFTVCYFCPHLELKGLSSDESLPLWCVCVQVLY